MICALIELLCEPVILYMNLKVENKFIPITVSSLTRIITNTIFAVFFKLDLWSFTLLRIIGSLVYLSFFHIWVILNITLILEILFLKILVY